MPVCKVYILLCVHCLRVFITWDRRSSFAQLPTVDQHIFINTFWTVCQTLPFPKITWQLFFIHIDIHQLIHDAQLYWLKFGPQMSWECASCSELDSHKVTQINETWNWGLVGWIILGDHFYLFCLAAAWWRLFPKTVWPHVVSVVPVGTCFWFTGRQQRDSDPHRPCDCLYYSKINRNRLKILPLQC